MNTTQTAIEKHLRSYLLRAQGLWRLYNESMDGWINENPTHDGAPMEGSFPEVGISSFNRHGSGIRIQCEVEIVEFDFLPKYVEKKEYLDIEEIDIYWSFQHYQSLYPNTEMTIEKWINTIEVLDERGVLKKLSWNRCAFAGGEVEGDWV